MGYINIIKVELYVEVNYIRIYKYQEFILKIMDYNLLRGLNQYKIALTFLPRTDKKLKLLEVGAQHGILKEFLPRNISYISLDMDEESDYDVDLNNEKMPFENESFDIVVCLETLEHVLYPYRVLEELKRVVKRNGLMILSMPNEYNFYLRLNYLFGKKLNQIDEPFMIVEKLQHIHKPRVEDILSFFGRHLSINRVKYTWQSGRGKNNKFFLGIDKLINGLAQVWPSLFSRLVVVSGRKK